MKIGVACAPLGLTLGVQTSPGVTSFRSSLDSSNGEQRFADSQHNNSPEHVSLFNTSVARPANVAGGDTEHVRDNAPSHRAPSG